MADGIVDRDGDGRVDQWIFRENGEIARVELDENRDGRPDRILHYDLGTHQIRRVEEDGNADGVSDSWTDYEDGRVSRRRGDGDYDGVADTWSFYRDGVITRHEQDTTGDGFRDRMGYYVDGKLVREEHDRDGDGRKDVWSSLPDSLATAANYLRRSGWRSGQTWGRQVRLPAGSRHDGSRLLADWQELGVRRIDGRDLPEGDLRAEVVLPLRRLDPAFLVYRNYRTFLSWNRSTFFAISVGALADEIAGAPSLRACGI